MSHLKSSDVIVIFLLFSLLLSLESEPKLSKHRHAGANLFVDADGESINLSAVRAFLRGDMRVADILKQVDSDK